ncbi:MAG TPA: hypothetical protein VJT67_00175 [Longimicrobiaceae bacterium]|nr:hypothetical protein [Longimicrobiaceae bacterium]
MLRSARDRQLFFALLAHLERGWEIIRPLYLAANRISCGPGLGGRTAEDVRSFIECDPVDIFRGIAHACMRAVPQSWERPEPRSFELVADEAGDVARSLRILALGTADPAFPPELRDLVRSAAREMTAWQAQLASVLEPVDECLAA